MEAMVQLVRNDAHVPHAIHEGRSAEHGPDGGVCSLFMAFRNEQEVTRKHVQRNRREVVQCAMVPSKIGIHAWGERSPWLMTGIKRMTNPVTKKHPLTPKMLRALKSQMNMDDPKHQLTWGGLVLGYFFLLRRSEYLKMDGKWFHYVLRLGDIRFYNANEDECSACTATMLGIPLKGAKSNQ